jgi:Tfp pilus assembly PilM family ATPase
MSVSHHIGLEIAGSCFRLVELQRQDHHTVVLRADVYDTGENFASPRMFDLPFDRGLAKTFISDLLNALTASAIYSPAVSLVLPSDLPLVATLPLDVSVAEQERMALLEWECRTLMGFAEGTAMSVLMHPIRRDGVQSSALVVALPQSLVDFLNSVFSHLTFELAAIDIDHFVMENLVRLQYPKYTADGLAVLGLFASHCSAGIYHGSVYSGFRLGQISYRQQYASQALRLIEDLSTRRLDNVYCFGAGYTTHIGDALGGLLNAHVSRCMPITDPGAEEVFRKSGDPDGERVFDVAAAAAVLGLG